MQSPARMFNNLDPISAAASVKAKALELGFSTAGVADATRPLTLDHLRYLEALREGLLEPIGYLNENIGVRGALNTVDMLPGALSVVVVAARYDRPEPDLGLASRVARYARGQDYHNYLRKKLRALAKFVRSLGPNIQARPLMDTAPVLERAWAVQAGVGFLGKNGLVITPGLGSQTLLGEVITTLPLAADTAIEERCGRCTLCLDACPTMAFARPFVLDTRRCISTWTIESQAIAPPALRPKVAERLFGCDVCQDVCPHNRSRPEDKLASRHRPLPAWHSLDLIELARLGMSDGPSLDQLLEGSPVRRAGPNGLARSACMLLGALQRHDAHDVLRDIHTNHPNEMVRQAALWALERLEVT